MFTQCFKVLYVREPDIVQYLESSDGFSNHKSIKMHRKDMSMTFVNVFKSYI
jgi:hypothetical protein